MSVREGGRCNECEGGREGDAMSVREGGREGDAMSVREGGREVHECEGGRSSWSKYLLDIRIRREYLVHTNEWPSARNTLLVTAYIIVATCAYAYT